MISNYFEQIFKLRYENHLLKLSKATVKGWGSKTEKFPFLEKKLKVKIIFERFTAANKNE